MYVDFLINKSSDISFINTSTENEVFNKEIKRILKKVKIKSPAYANGNAVNIKYSIPIIFKGSPSSRKPRPIYTESKLISESLKIKDLSKKPNYYFSKEYLNAETYRFNDKNLHKKINPKKNSTPRRYFSNLYNHISIYKISAYLHKGINKIPIYFTIDEKGNMTRIEVKSESEAINDYLKEIIQELPKLTTGYKDQQPIAIDYKLILAYSKTN